MTHHFAKLPLGLLCLTLALAATTPAWARSRSRTIDGPRGSATRTVEREPGRTHRETVVTNNSGRTASHAVDRTWDRNTRTGTVSIQTTLPDGRTVTRDGTFRKNDDGRTRIATKTGPSGNTATKEINVSKSGSNVIRTRSITRTTGGE